MATGKRNHYFVVRVPNIAPKRELANYVREAVRGWAGGSEPDHPLYKYSVRKKIVVTSTLYEMEKETLMNLKKDLKRYFENTTAPTHVWQSVMSLIDGYIGRS